MKNLIFICLAALQISALAQIPSIIHSPQTALENVEAQVLSATTDEMEELFTCNFQKDSTDYRLYFLSSGQNDVAIELQDSTSKYSYTAGRTLTNYQIAAVKHDYSSKNYNEFMQSLIVDFINDGKAKVSLDFNNSSTQWSNLENRITNDVTKANDIKIELVATSKERSTIAQCFVSIGCAISEGWELTSQSWRFMNDAEDLEDWGNRLMLSRFTSMTSIALASKYDEKLQGSIIIDGKPHDLTCGDEFLPHYYKSSK